MVGQRSRALTLTTPSDREIEITRVFDAPRKLVFETCLNPDLIPRWWGPRDHTTTVDKMEVRPGGEWRFVSRDRDGNEFAFHGVYREIVAPERVVQTFEFEGMPGHVSEETATYEEHDGKTTLTVRSRFQSAGDRDGMLQSGMEQGVTETYERLAELLATLA